MNTSGEQTCKGYLCKICGEFYGEAAPNAHDWSIFDGICVNGCGIECDHAGRTGEACEIPGGCPSHIMRKQWHIINTAQLCCISPGLKACISAGSMVCYAVP